MKKLIVTLLLLLPFSILYAQDTLNVPGEYSTIQAAIDAATNGDIVLVDEDIYYENINFRGKAITVASHFLIDGNETHIENTIIDGSQPSNPDTASVVTFDGGEDTTSVLCGFTITGGTGIYTWEYGDRAGGGIYIDSSGAKIIHNYIEYNTVDYDGNAWGGGILAFSVGNHNLIIRDNVISNNSVTGTNWAVGGGIVLWNDGQAAYIKHNKILDNTVTGQTASGGGIDCYGPINEVYIVSNYIKGNSVSSITSYGGGGIDIYECTIQTPVVSNNLIIGNYTNKNGGGILVDQSEGDSPILRNNRNAINSQPGKQLNLNILINNTIVDNEAAFGGGIYSSGSLTEIINCILWGNDAPVGPQIWGSPHVYYSDIEGGYLGTGNIDSIPIFSDTLYRLSNSSPCMEVGIDSIDIEGTMYYCPPFCYFGIPRPSPSGTMPDMGACENPNPPSGIQYDLSLIPNEYSLSQNFPNPFNPTTTIVYGLRERTNVELKLFDALGREIEAIVKGEQDAGYYEMEFNASRLASGIYFYRLQAGNFFETKKMILLR